MCVHVAPIIAYLSVQVVKTVKHFNMKILLTACFAILFSASAFTQDTFSIVAVDTITGEVGSAGASCLDDNSFPGSGGAIIISDILPGKGAIHTQSYWVASNQANARLKMEEGLAPKEIILWLNQNDAEPPFGNQRRQYGIVDLDPNGQARSAGFTGTSCFDFKDHKTGPNYAIQGNILLGPQILDSIEARFLAATGTLANRLMYALQGANVPGADSRCLNNGTSSLSAFLRVAKPGDAEDNLYLDLNVPSLPQGMEPIDSLQTLFNQWSPAGVATKEPGKYTAHIFPNPAKGQFSVVWEGDLALVQLFDLTGLVVLETALQKGENRLKAELPAGIYLLQISREKRVLQSKKIVWTPE